MWTEAYISNCDWIIDWKESIAARELVYVSGLHEWVQEMCADLPTPN